MANQGDERAEQCATAGVEDDNDRPVLSPPRQVVGIQQVDVRGDQPDVHEPCQGARHAAHHRPREGLRHRPAARFRPPRGVAGAAGQDGGSKADGKTVKAVQDEDMMTTRETA